MNAKNRFWRMLLIVVCDSFRARTMPVRSPLSSVTPALSIATSVPVPMAMPTSTAAIPQFRDDRALLIRQHLGFDLGNPELLRNGLRRGAVVAGQHDDLDAFGRERLQRFRRRRLHGIGDRKQSSESAVDRNTNDSCAVGAQPFGFTIQC